jgi:hypothetical protein
MDPVVIGGNGHSGTRVFNEVVTLGGVFTGVRRLTKHVASEDLKVIDLLTRWVHAYVSGTLDQEGSERMRRAFGRRLRLYFPLRSRPWGFKNPRSMLLLPFLSAMFPAMKFIHVIRDGRDISLGNKFVQCNPYVDVFLQEDEASLPPEEKMILFWGRSNARAADFAAANMQGRYLRMKWEDLCRNPRPNVGKLLDFVGSRASDVDGIAGIVRTPGSMGRWKGYAADEQARVSSRGQPWLARFGYLQP